MKNGKTFLIEILVGIAGAAIVISFIVFVLVPAFTANPLSRKKAEEETVYSFVQETAGEAAGETAGETAGEAVGETAGEAVPGLVQETQALWDTAPDMSVMASGEQMEQTDTQSSAQASLLEGDFVFPDSNQRYLTEDDLRYLSAEELRIARNEIYARLGRTFDTETLQAYFNAKPWYNGRIAPGDFKDEMLNEYERSNTRFIKAYEEKRSTGEAVQEYRN